MSIITPTAEMGPSDSPWAGPPQQVPGPLPVGPCSESVPRLKHGRANVLPGMNGQGRSTAAWRPWPVCVPLRARVCECEHGSGRGLGHCRDKIETPGQAAVQRFVRSF